jgi:predicted ATP-grasp superfamily ATP-dependent carboligase
VTHHPSVKTSGRARAVLAGDLDLLRPLHAAGVPTILLLRKRQRFLRHSRIVREWVDFPDPATEAEKAIEVLFDVARAQSERPVLYYADDAMLSLVRRHRAHLESLYRLLMPADEIVLACADKIRFAALAEGSSVPVPKSAPGAEVRSADDVAAFGYPLVIKPASHVGWFASEAVELAGGKSRKIVVAEDRQEFETLLAATRRSTEDFIVQEFIPGGEDQVYSFHAFVRPDGAPVASFVGRKIRTYPAVGGESSYITLVRDFAIQKLGRETVRKLNLSGPVKIDFKRDPRTQRDYVLEVNLRFNLWHQLGAVCGVNLMLTAYEYLTGAPASFVADYRTDVRWLDIYGDLRAFLGDYRPAKLYTWKTYLASLKAPKVYHLFAWKDPLPLFLAALNFAKAAAARLMRRIPARARRERTCSDSR